MNSVTIKRPDMLLESHSRLQSMLQDLYHSFRHDADGVIANHLPELSQADPNWFGLSAVTLDGTMLEAGDSHITFTVQSIAKPLYLRLHWKTMTPIPSYIKSVLNPPGNGLIRFCILRIKKIIS